MNTDTSATGRPPELAVILPVYNESGAIEVVIDDWSALLNSLQINYQLHAYDDGSTDNTLELLQQLAQHRSRLVVHTHSNCGHGPTLLQAYNQNKATPWLFQVDSDNEMPPEPFRELWGQRDSFDLLIGNRIHRASPPIRCLITWVSRWAVSLRFGRGVIDVNCPYRLFRSACFAEHIAAIPADTFAPNLILSGIAAQQHLRIFQLNITHTARATGTTSIRHFKLLRAAVRSFLQTFRG